MSNSIFSIAEVTDDYVIVKVNADDNFTVARHFYIQRDYDYITVTRGCHHIITVIRKDGSTFSWGCGGGRSTIVDDATDLLRNKLFEFIDAQNILLDLTFSQIEKVRIGRSKRTQWHWTMRLVNKDGRYSNEYISKATSFDDMVKDVSRFVHVKKWTQVDSNEENNNAKEPYIPLEYESQGVVTLVKHEKQT